MKNELKRQDRMANAGKVVLVTGGAGYIGSHTCKALSQCGYVPVTLDNLSTGHAAAVKWGPLHHGDVRDTRFVADVLDRTGAAAVMHFAASAYVGESMTDPQKYYRNNVTGMTSLLDAIALAGIDTLVFSSSCATYGEPTVTPIAEDTAQVPINPYGRTKLICEQMIQDYARAHPLHYAMLRYFNAAGADLEGDLVEDHDPETHLIPCVLNAALGVTEEFRIFGDDYATPDGTCIRDFIHVGDLAEGHTRALDHLLGGGESLTLNLGTGQGSSIMDVIAACETAASRVIPKRIVAGRKGDPARLIANSQRAHELLGFVPSRSDLATIVSSALRGLRKVHGVTS